MITMVVKTNLQEKNGGGEDGNANNDGSAGE
jgi:hypothetical protein